MGTQAQPGGHGQEERGLTSAQNGPRRRRVPHGRRLPPRGVHHVRRCRPPPPHAAVFSRTHGAPRVVAAPEQCSLLTAHCSRIEPDGRVSARSYFFPVRSGIEQLLHYLAGQYSGTRQHRGRASGEPFPTSPVFLPHRPAWVCPKSLVLPRDARGAAALSGRHAPAPPGRHRPAPREARREMVRGSLPASFEALAHANLAAAAPLNSSFQTVVLPGSPGYALCPSDKCHLC